MSSGIYEIRNQVNGKFYIGSAANLKARWRIHLSTLRHGKHGNRHLQAAFLKYGEKAFEFSVLEYVEDSCQRVVREQHYFDTLQPDYNIAQIAGTSPMLGRHCSPEHRTKISRAKMGHSVSADTRAKISAAWPRERRRKLSVAMTGERNPNYGKHPSAETQAKFRAARMGHSTSDETRAKISAAMTGERNPNYGKHPSTETRAKMSAARMGHPVSDETRLKLSKAMSGTRNPMYGRSGDHNPMYGKHHSEEACKKISKAWTPERRQAQSEKQIGERNHMYGKHPSDEMRKRMGEAQKARWRRIHAMGAK